MKFEIIPLPPLLFFKTTNNYVLQGMEICDKFCGQILGSGGGVLFIPKEISNNHDFQEKMYGGHDAAMPYLKVLLIVWFRKTFKLIFLKQPFWPKTIYPELKRTSMGAFPGKSFYTFITTILRNTCEKLLTGMCYYIILIYFRHFTF